MLQLSSRHLLSNISREPDARYPGFRGGVCRSPIRYRHRWHRDLLIQVALDPDIDAMEPAKMDVPGSLAFVVRRASSRMLVVGVHDRSPRPEIVAREPAVLVCRATVLMEPFLSDARAVWATRHCPIAASDRVRILAHLDRVSEAELRDLAALVREPADGVETVLGMACAGELSVSLSDGICPQTKVRRRRARPVVDADAHP